MHIVLVSACEKRAIKKTRAVLDSYAIRTGDGSWATPITTEGMRELRSAMKRCATRQTAVACYRNVGRRGMKLLWIVGSRRPFGPDGHFPCGTTLRKSAKEPLAEWVRSCALLAQAGGLGHDPGKSLQHFQRKLHLSLENVFPAEADPVRHEWISMRLLQEMRHGSVEEAWKALYPNSLKRLSLAKGVSNHLDVIDFIVATHHKLFGPDSAKGGSAVPTCERHLRDPRADLQPAASLPPAWHEAHADLLRRIEKMATEASPGYWRGMAIWARAALIFADHHVSAIEQEKYDLPDDGLFANTIRTDQGKRRFNQPLQWHLKHVAQEAGRNAYRMATLRLPTLSEEAVERILEPANDQQRFAWQNRAVDTLAKLRQQDESPVLVMNVASTGAGKTRMNAKCACVLGPAGRIRFAVALNQRTLTLQTGDALSMQLGIGKDELATVIGDRVTTVLHAAARDAATMPNLDGNQPEVEFESDADLTGIDLQQDLPEWLSRLTARKPSLGRILGAPVLASTIDYLVAAGELNRQGNHVAALLRLIDSDIVLDEIDSYDPKSMMAVLRLIQMVGLCGRNLICSSATLAYPLAQAVHDAYCSGLEMRAQLNGVAAAFSTAIIDDLVAPTVIRGKRFAEEYPRHIGRMLAQMGKKKYRVPVLQAVAERRESAWMKAVEEAVLRMHRINAWSFADGGKEVSFGLVRVANIGTAIKVARYLAERLPQARIAAYHSQDFVIQRFLKERRLDFLLNRKGGDGHIGKDAEISAIVAASNAPGIPFIVVATPVEEIGRDHDFDWAVVEPSSSQSIVQTAGRVNRHRLVPVIRPNVAILQYNFRWARGKDVCFQRPGLETAELKYDRHDLAELLNWDHLGEGLDARLRFGSHRLAQLDDQSIIAAMKGPLAGLSDLSKESVAWMTECFYRDYPLRDGGPKQIWRLGKDGDGDDQFQRLELVTYEEIFVGREGWVRRSSRVNNDWLCFDIRELRDFCGEFGIREEDGLRFELVKYSRRNTEEQAQERVAFDPSFGLYLDPGN